MRSRLLFEVRQDLYFVFYVRKRNVSIEKRNGTFIIGLTNNYINWNIHKLEQINSE